MSRIALIPGSFKPYHAGHDAVIRLAAADSDRVIVFASTASRARKGELTIDGDRMRLVMDRFVKPSLAPLGNVEVVDTSTSPVTAVFETLHAADAGPDEYVIYSDVDDIKKYTDSVLARSAPTLMSSGRIQRVGLTRGGETPDISATAVRAAMAAGDIDAVASAMPPSIRRHTQEIVDILMGVSESLLRRFIAESLRRGARRR